MFNILKKEDRVKVISQVHPWYSKPINGKVKNVINPREYLIESEEIEIDGYPVIVTFTLLTDKMEYESTK